MVKIYPTRGAEAPLPGWRAGPLDTGRAMRETRLAGPPRDRRGAAERRGSAGGVAGTHRAVLARIRTLRPSLTPSEAAVAALTLARAAEVVGLGVAALARRAGVSTATVLRFSHTLGFAGFKDFKIALAVESGRSPAVLAEEIRDADPPAQIARKVFQADMQAIGQTLELLDERAFNRAVGTLDTARRIEVYGIGSSAPIAVDAYYRLLRIGLPVGVVTDAHMQAVSASLLRKGDVALVISHTGRTRETLTAAEQARAAGATVIALTSFQRSPVTRIAHVVLVTASAETAFRVEAMASRIAHLSVIDALYVALATRRRHDALEALGRTSAIIEEKRVERDARREAMPVPLPPGPSAGIRPRGTPPPRGRIAATRGRGRTPRRDYYLPHGEQLDRVPGGRSLAPVARTFKGGTGS
jgi:RpiR family carbohydrate utilization transcriptional regulator